MFKIFSDGPNNLTLTREDVPEEEEMYYNICPNRTNINFTCQTNDVYPSAELSMTSDPEGVEVVGCEFAYDASNDTAGNPLTRISCDFVVFPNISGDNIFNCTGINTAFRYMVFQDQKNITVRGNKTLVK